MLVYRVVCYLQRSDRRIRLCISHQSVRRFGSLVWEMFKFQQSNGGFGESGSQDGIILLLFNAYFTALKEKCDTTEQMKDIRLSTLNVLLMLWKWWVVVREKMESCAL